VLLRNLIDRGDPIPLLKSLRRGGSTRSLVAILLQRDMFDYGVTKRILSGLRKTSKASNDGGGSHNAHALWVGNCD